MKNLKYIKTMLLITAIFAGLTAGTVCINNVMAQPSVVQNNSNVQTQQTVEVKVNPLVVVDMPRAYLNKNIVMNAKFDKFSTLGLDYKPAFKSSDDYISFLIKRNDTQFDIPLSEMKLFLKRTTAEKFIDLKTNDEIEIKGKVFSDALGDAWIDVSNIAITKKAPDNDNK